MFDAPESDTATKAAALFIAAHSILVERKRGCNLNPYKTRYPFREICKQCRLSSDSDQSLQYLLSGILNQNQLMQLCTDQAVRAMHSCNSW